jgi:hypothetical protein
MMVQVEGFQAERNRLKRRPTLCSRSCARPDKRAVQSLISPIELALRRAACSTDRISVEACVIPSAALRMLSAIDCVVSACSLTAAATEVDTSVISRILPEIEAISLTASLVIPWIAAICFAMSSCQSAPKFDP